MINLRIKEEQRDVGLKQSALSEHNIETGHQILFDKMITITILTNIISYFSRKYKEVIEIQKH